MKNILVFFGGVSPERDISVITGVLTARSLSREKYFTIPIFISETGEFYTGEKLLDISFYQNIDYRCVKRCILTSGENTLYILKGARLKAICDVDCAINCMHGQMGEDGTISGILRHSKIPEVAPDVFCQSLAIDKDFTKIVARGIDIPTVQGISMNRDEFFSKTDYFIELVANELGYPIIIKPARLGSSIGIENAKNPDQLFVSIVRAFRYDDKVVCEKYLENSRDINCAAYKAEGSIKISKLEEPLKHSEILSFQDKYGGGKLENCKKRAPDDLNAEIQEKIRIYTKTLYQRLQFSGIVRFDFLVNNEQVYLNEINAIPGSLAYYLFCDKLIEFSELIGTLVEDAIKVNVKKKSLLTKFESNILKGDWKSIKK